MGGYRIISFLRKNRWGPIFSHLDLSRVVNQKKKNSYMATRIFFVLEQSKSFLGDQDRPVLPILLVSQVRQNTKFASSCSLAKPGV